MIARPVIRPRPIPFNAPTTGAHAPRPVCWAASSGPAPQSMATLRGPTPPNGQAAANEATPNKPPATRPNPRAAINLKASRQTTAAPAATIPYTSPASKGASELRARYVGNGALSVRSSVTGRHYRFQGYGDSQKIDKHDMLMLKRIPDLVIS